MVKAADAAAKGLSRLKKYSPNTAFFENNQLLKKHFKSPLYSLDSGISSHEVCAYYRDIIRRTKGRPLQYILGEWEFMSRPFYVNSDVLIPRPDTETLAMEAIRLLKDKKNPFIIDLCTGSGCLAVSVLTYLQNARAAACDISAAALSVAFKNAKRNGVEDRLYFFEWDVLSGKPLSSKLQNADLIMCNPPYIKSDEFSGLDHEVSLYEPRLALDGGKDGLVFYRSVAALAKTALSLGGTLIFEHGFDQGDDVCDILENNGYKDIRTLYDLSGKKRCAAAVKG